MEVCQEQHTGSADLDQEVTCLDTSMLDVYDFVSDSSSNVNIHASEYRTYQDDPPHTDTFSPFGRHSRKCREASVSCHLSSQYSSSQQDEGTPSD